jgi:hypothetical protein
MKDKMAERAAFKKQVKEGYKSFDLFGQEIKLTWNGEEQYKTTLGATVSIAIIVIMLAYTITRFGELVNRKNPSISKVTLIRTPEEDAPYAPYDTGFDFAFSLSKDLDPRYGFFTLNHIKQEVVNDKRVKQKFPL